MARTLESPAGAGEAGAGLALALVTGAVLAWLALMLIVLRIGGLAPAESGRLFVVFPPGTSKAAGFAAIVGAGGAPVRRVLGGWAWIAHDDAPAFVGRLEAAGALGAFRGVPGGLTLAGCFAVHHRRASGRPARAGARGALCRRRHAPMTGVTGQIRRAAGRAVRLTEGGVRVTALCDGCAGIQADRFPTLDRAAAAPLAAAGGITLDDMAVSVNCFLIEDGGRRYLVDAGNGGIRGPDLGHLPAALAAAGCPPDRVDLVLMTHMHGDHCVGLYDEEGRAAFSKATLIAAADEHRFWQEASGLNEMQRTQVEFARTAFAAYAGRTTLAAPGAEVAPGIEMVALPGHTPGHVGYLIGSARLLLWGDIAHVPALQMPRPDWYFRFEVDPAAAIATRRQVLARAAAGGLIVAGAHLPFPGAGRIRSAGAAFRYVPLEP